MSSSSERDAPQDNAPQDNAQGAAFEVLTFDCYGTLIDWRRGVREAAARLESLAQCDFARLELDREQAEAVIEAGPYQPYGRVLAQSIVRAGAMQEREVAEHDAQTFAASMAHWHPFDDSREGLARLAKRYRLAILSNVETSVLEASARALGAPFEALITAEELESYKPAHKHFEVALERLAVPPGKILHVAGSLFHDIGPTQELGWTSAWVNRDGEQLPQELHPRWVTSDLAGLVQALGC